MLGLELALRGVLEGAAIGIAGLGFAIIFRTARELHFAYGVTIAIGGYASYSMTSVGVPIAIAMVLAAVISAGIGAVIRYTAYRHLGHDAVLLFSFGLAVVLENVLLIVYGVHNVVLDSPALNRVVQIIPETNLSARIIDLLNPVIVLIAWLAVRRVVGKTKTGLGMTAVIRDPEMAELVGVKVERMKVLSYAIGSGLAGIAGAMTVVASGVKPTLGFKLLLFGFIATMLAGNRFTRAALWGIVIGVALNLSAWWLPAHYGTVVVFAGLITYLVVRMRKMPRFAI